MWIITTNVDHSGSDIEFEEFRGPRYDVAIKTIVIIIIPIVPIIGRKKRIHVFQEVAYFTCYDKAASLSLRLYLMRIGLATNNHVWGYNKKFTLALLFPP